MHTLYLQKDQAPLEDEFPQIGISLIPSYAGTYSCYAQKLTLLEALTLLSDICNKIVPQIT